MTHKEYPFATVCLECRKVLLETETIEQARHFATLHTRLTPHLMAFGYERAEAARLARKWNKEESLEAERLGL